MPAVLDVSSWPAEPEDQKVPQPRFRAGEIMMCVERTQHGIVRNLPVERAH
jgi:hypothetical protein